jgi:excisionase family DNA binding protein
MFTTSIALQKNPVPPLVKVRDVAKLLSVSRCTVHKLIDSGALAGSKINPATKKRQHLRITRTSLLKFYEKRFGHSLAAVLVNPFES